jgi:hypothetical protein
MIRISTSILGPSSVSTSLMQVMFGLGLSSLVTGLFFILFLRVLYIDTAYCCYVVTHNCMLLFEICALLGYYAASRGNCLPTFRAVLVPFFLFSTRTLDPWRWDRCVVPQMSEWVWSIGGMILTGETELLGEKHYTGMVVDVWMSMEHWWNDTDRGNWCTGREILYSVGGRCMNEYGALVEWYWQGKTEVLGEKPVTVPLFPPQIWNEVAWDRTRFSAVWDRRLTWHNDIKTPFPPHRKSVSITIASQLILYREIIAVCSEIHTKHINTLCGQNEELLNVKLVVHIVTTGIFKCE